MDKKLRKILTKEELAALDPNYKRFCIIDLDRAIIITDEDQRASELFGTDLVKEK